MILKSGQSTDYQFEVFKKFSSHDAYPEAEKWLRIIRSIDEVVQAEITGDLRRGKSAVGNIEIVVASPNEEAVITSVLGFNEYVEMEEASNINMRLLLSSGIELIIWFVKPDSFGSTLQLTTGSQSHNDALFTIAESLNMSYRGGSLEVNGITTSFDSEESLYRTLGLPLIPPELREGLYEFDGLHKQNFGELITQNDIKTDLHIHTNYSDGKNSIEEVVCGAIIRNLSGIAISDHSPSILFPRYINDDYLYQQLKEIDQLQKKYHSQIKIFKGIEVDILQNGEIDLSNDLLHKMDIVTASLHVELDQPQDEITTRLIRAIENPFVNIIGHPGGRLYPMSDTTDLDWDRVFRAAAYNQVALEINSHKSHPLFDDERVRQAAKMGVPISIGSDSHSTAMLDQSRFGLSIARRAGLKSDQVINTWTPKHLQLWLEQRRKSTLKLR